MSQFCRLFVGCLLLVAGTGKFFFLGEYQKLIRAYVQSPAWLSGPLALSLAVAEGLTGVALLARLIWPVPVFAAAALFAVFALVVASQLLRGKTELTCGCFGRSRQRLSWHVVVRDLGLAGMSLAALGPFRASETVAIISALGTVFATAGGFLKRGEQASWPQGGVAAQARGKGV